MLPVIAAGRIFISASLVALTSRFCEGLAWLWFSPMMRAALDIYPLRARSFFDDDLITDESN
jgi:hypothetical protein